MSNRTLRVNELIQRELGDILHRKYKDEALEITISSVEVAPDLRDGKIMVAVFGDAEIAAKKMRWLRHHSQEIRFELGRRIVLKYMPQFTYVLDETTARGNRILGLLDEIGAADAARPAPAADATPAPSTPGEKPASENAAGAPVAGDKPEGV